MIFNIKLNCTADRLCSEIDNYIREDCEYVLPAYGAFRTYPKGFHFRRKGKRIFGIYRKSVLDGTTPAVRYLPRSSHTNFRARVVTKKNGKAYLRGFCYPQYYQIFLAILLLSLGILFSLGGAMRALVFVTFFLSAFLLIFLDGMRNCFSTARKLSELVKRFKT